MSDLSKRIQNISSREGEVQPSPIYAIVTNGVSRMERAMERYIHELENLLLI